MQAQQVAMPPFNYFQQAPSQTNLLPHQQITTPFNNTTTNNMFAPTMPIQTTNPFLVSAFISSFNFFK